MKSPRCLIALAALALQAPLHAAGIVPSQIPASAKWLFHADVDAIRTSETGKAIFARIEADHGDKLRAAKRMFAFHPLDDAHGVTLFGDGTPEHAVVLIDGTFDRAHVEDVVHGAENYTGSNYAGFVVHGWTDKGVRQFASFASPTLLVFSRQEDLLDQALDTLKANAPATADPFFTVAGGTPLVVASAKLSEIEALAKIHMPLGEGEAKFIRMAQTLRVVVSETAGRLNVRLAAETKTPKDAARLGRILDGVIALGEVSDANLEKLDLKAEVTVDSTPPATIGTISASVPELLSLLEKLAGGAKK